MAWLDQAAEHDSKAEVAGFAFYDTCLNIIVGPFPSSEEARDFALQNGHFADEIQVAMWTNRWVWKQTMELSNG